MADLKLKAVHENPMKFDCFWFQYPIYWKNLLLTSRSLSADECPKANLSVLADRVAIRASRFQGARESDQEWSGLFSCCHGFGHFVIDFLGDPFGGIMNLMFSKTFSQPSPCSALGLPQPGQKLSFFPICLPHEGQMITSSLEARKSVTP